MAGKERTKSKNGMDNAKKEMIVKRLRERGCRITRQRLELLDIILDSECSSCKEIYYKASKKDPDIGTATIYRMVNLLEKIGVIDRKNMYRVTEATPIEEESRYIVVLDDHTTRYLSERKLNLVLRKGLQACGDLEEQNISYIITEPSESKKKSRN